MIIPGKRRANKAQIYEGIIIKETNKTLPLLPDENGLSSPFMIEQYNY